MFFQSISAEVDGTTCDKDSDGKIKVKDAGIGATQFANKKLGLVSDTTTSTSPSYIEFTGLDSSACGGYLMVFNVSPTVAGGSKIQLFANGDTTASNYVYSNIGSNGNNANAIADNNNETAWGMVWISVDLDGKFNAVSFCAQRDNGDSDVYGLASDSALTDSKISSLRVDIEGSGGTFDDGSRVMLYEIQEQ